MKKSIVIAALLLAFQFVGWSQAKKPTIMVVPADAFCERYGYVQQANAMGQTVSSPDYARAMKENADIRQIPKRIPAAILFYVLFQCTTPDCRVRIAPSCNTKF